MFTKLDHFAINVTNMEKSILFYTEIFGFNLLSDQIIPNGMRIVYLSLNNTILELNETTEKTKGCHFCLHSNTFDQALTYLENKGLEYAMKKHKTQARQKGEENWHRAVFFGPDHEQIEIRG